MHAIRQLSAPELRAILDSGQPLELVDVRTPEEWELARIDGARLLDNDYFERLLAMDRQALLVFQCHHGIRSQAAAEYFARAGFEHVCNLEGGIEAWSLLVDPAVQRY